MRRAGEYKEQVLNLGVGFSWWLVVLALVVLELVVIELVVLPNVSWEEMVEEHTAGFPQREERRPLMEL